VRTSLDGSLNDTFKWNCSVITDLLGRGKSYAVETESQFDSALRESEKINKDFVLIEVLLNKFDWFGGFEKIDCLAKEKTQY
jgi:TPP-dependent 2-oxoacid decarboxylase